MPHSAPPPLERARSEHPTDAAWRADALATSRHTRWIHELREPLEDHDPERAAAICAQVTRAALRDFAPALILLDRSSRRRAQALAAYTLVLFDFAGQTGLEGERLAQINRLEFDLETALEGEPPGQPVFVSMAHAHRETPWPREALDRLAAAARRRVTQPRPATDRDVAADAHDLGGALAEALSGVATEKLSTLAAALVRLAALLGIGEASRRHRQRLSLEALPEDWMAGGARTDRLELAIGSECDRIVELLRAAAGEHAGLSAGERRAARNLRLSAHRLLARARRSGSSLLDGRPSLGALSRVALLLRSRLGF